MNKRINLLIIIVLCVFMSGCSLIAETGRFFWGTSIRHLEKVRPDAISRSYQCVYDHCYDAVLSLALHNEDVKPESQEKIYKVFQENRLKGWIVFMGIPGNVDTTEVGIFFSRDSQSGSIRIEMTS